MTRYQRLAYFERLCELRAQYRRRGADDRRGGTALAEFIAAVEMMLRRGAHQEATAQPA